MKLFSHAQAEKFSGLSVLLYDRIVDSHNGIPCQCVDFSGFGKVADFLYHSDIILGFLSVRTYFGNMYDVIDLTADLI